MDKKILKAAADTMRELGLSEVRIKDTETEIVLKREITAPISGTSVVAAYSMKRLLPTQLPLFARAIL